jgi:mannose-6-phosphate isomerase-like protein (cupin superfamily)
MQRKALRFAKGFKVVLGNRRSQAAQMVIESGQAEGDATNRHAGADQWLLVIAGRGVATINRRRYALGPNTLLLIEHGDRHEIRNTGPEPLQTLNFYVPPAYRADGEELPPAKRGGADARLRLRGQPTSSEPSSSAASCRGRKNCSAISAAGNSLPCRITLMPAT